MQAWNIGIAREKSGKNQNPDSSDKSYSQEAIGRSENISSAEDNSGDDASIESWESRQNHNLGTPDHQKRN